VALIEEYELEFSRSSEPCPHAAQTWKAVASRFPCAISSRNTRLAVHRTLSRHGIWDPRTSVPLVGFQDVERHKPDPASLLRLAERLHLVAGDTAVHVGDHVNDLAASRSFNQHGGAHLVPITCEAEGAGGRTSWRIPRFTRASGSPTCRSSFRRSSPARTHGDGLKTTSTQ